MNFLLTLNDNLGPGFMQGNLSPTSGLHAQQYLKPIVDTRTLPVERQLALNDY